MVTAGQMHRDRDTANSAAETLRRSSQTTTVPDQQARSSPNKRRAAPAVRLPSRADWLTAAAEPDYYLRVG